MADIDDDVDLAVLVTPPALIPRLIEQGADLGIRHFLVISAGFKEVGGEGLEREQQLKRIAAERDLSIVAPIAWGSSTRLPTFS